MRWTEQQIQSCLSEAQAALIPSPHTRDASAWLSWLEPEQADLVRARAEGTPWKLICWRFGISRPTAYRRWRHALRLIAWRLNGNALPAGCSRRRFMQLAAPACETLLAETGAASRLTLE